MLLRVKYVNRMCFIHTLFTFIQMHVLSLCMLINQFSTTVHATRSELLKLTATTQYVISCWDKVFFKARAKSCSHLAKIMSTEWVRATALVKKRSLKIIFTLLLYYVLDQNYFHQGTCPRGRYLSGSCLGSCSGNDCLG